MKKLGLAGDDRETVKEKEKINAEIKKEQEKKMILEREKFFERTKKKKEEEYRYQVQLKSGTRHRQDSLHNMERERA